MWARLILLLVLVGCVHPVPARLDTLAEPHPVEIDAKARREARTCPPVVGMLYPGVGPWCDGRVAEGATLVGVATADIAAAVAVPLANPGSAGQAVGLPLIWVQNAYVYSWMRPLMDRHLAERRPFVPRDTFGEMTAAPFNGHVLKRPAVWGTTLAALAGAFAITYALDPSSFGVGSGPVNWLGADLPPGLGWPVATLTGAYTFEHVALGEEAVFRGTVQSALARGMGPWGGWAVGSLIFGAAHIPNALLLPEDQQLSYLLFSVPYITLVGAGMGLAYMDARYSLTASIAIHFWYDLLLSLATVLVDPQNSFVSARIGGAF